ncbi:MAG: hypothetical protein C0485_03390 [Pirellula sp.]|nr:hypothetical protein [Pirellula sp.]
MTNLVDSPKAPPRAGVSRGLTLIEMLVALAVTLVMMAAVVNLFANMSASIRNRRAAIETGSQLRQVRNRLAMDLSGATCRGSTWQRPEANQGYIEIIEGEWSDKNPSELLNLTDAGPNSNGDREIDYTTSNIPSSQAFNSDTGLAADGRNIGVGAVTDGRALGDWDDVLALTVRSESDPFTARVGNNLVESPLAEVLWCATEKKVDNAATIADPNDGFRTVYRRVLLIAPWLGPFTGPRPPENVSVHWDPALGQWVANTLGDLTKRENRATRDQNTMFPHILVRNELLASSNNVELSSRVLNSALAFDVRVFDPGAPLIDAGAAILEPGDYGWSSALSAGGVVSGYGAYCDLGWGFAPPPTGSMVYQSTAAVSPAPLPLFNEIRPAGYHWISSPQTNTITQYPAVYDTWSYHYENDGIDQDALWQTNAQPWQLNNIDQGANGLDDNNANGVDDRGERETSPPYDVPLRGVKVILRVYEPDARQIRESSVTHSFKQ